MKVFLLGTVLLGSMSIIVGAEAEKFKEAAHVFEDYLQVITLFGEDKKSKEEMLVLLWDKMVQQDVTGALAQWVASRYRTQLTDVLSAVGAVPLLGKLGHMWQCAQGETSGPYIDEIGFILERRYRNVLDKKYYLMHNPLIEIMKFYRISDKNNPMIGWLSTRYEHYFYRVELEQYPELQLELDCFIKEGLRVFKNSFQFTPTKEEYFEVLGLLKNPNALQGRAQKEHSEVLRLQDLRK